MKRAIFSAMVLASAVAFSLPAQAADKSKTFIKGLGEVEAIRATSTIDAIDAKNRVVTLKGEKGNLFTVTAGKEVRNFDKLKVGDTVTIDYFEAIALEAKKTDAPPSATEVVEGDRAKKGAQPGAVVVRKVHIVTTVLGNNADTQTVLVRGPLGHLTEVKIRDPKVFESLKGGGNIELLYAEGMAINVTPGSKK